MRLSKITIYKLFNVLVAAFMILGFVGCGEETLQHSVNIPPPKKAAIRAGDTLVISLQSIPTPGQIQVTVNDQGDISMPYIGEIKAAGQTDSELARTARETYIDKKIYTNIDIAVSITQRFVHVGGEVNRPGRVMWSSDLTLTKAIQDAGGFGPWAKEAAVILNRDGITYTINVQEALRDPNRDFKLYPGDNIIVPRSTI